VYAAFDVLDFDAGVSICLLDTYGAFFVGLLGSVGRGERFSVAIQKVYVAVAAEFRGTCVWPVPCGFHFESESAVGLDASFASAATTIETAAVDGSSVETASTKWVPAGAEGC
jgi:predicted membrane-bound dolichyl-phosphate-mannose-protein mannosyltransferase